MQNTWYGLSYERVCMAHIQEILQALHLDTIHTEYYSFRSKEKSLKVQIDMIIDRSDDFVDIIEIKYSTSGQIDVFFTVLAQSWTFLDNIQRK